MRRSEVELQKQQHYKTKLKMIDLHSTKSQMFNNANLQFDDVLKFIALKFIQEPSIQLTPFVAKTVFFETKDPKNFVYKEQIAPKGQRYILNVTTHIPVKIVVIINEQKAKSYSLQGSKAIQIDKQGWKQLKITVSVQKIGLFSSVKLQMDLIKVEHHSPKKTNVNLRPKIDNELDEYLRNTRGKTAEIIRSRSVTRMKESISRRTASSSFKDIKKSVDLVKTKNQLLKFEKQKQFYIRHVGKMSPQHIQKLRHSENAYKNQKQRQISNLARLILIVKMGLYIKEKNVKLHLLKVKKIKISLLCNDFIKIIKNNLRIRVTQKARLRMNMLHTLKMITPMLSQSTINKSKITILETLFPYMEFRGLQEISENSEQYLNCLKKIQNHFKLRAIQLRKRMTIIVDKLCEKYYINISQKKKRQTIQKCLKYCLMKKSIKFYLDKQKILEELREVAFSD